MKRSATLNLVRSLVPGRSGLPVPRAVVEELGEKLENVYSLGVYQAVQESPKRRRNVTHRSALSGLNGQNGQIAALLVEEEIRSGPEIVFSQRAEHSSALEMTPKREHVTLTHAQTGHNGQIGVLAPSPAEGEPKQSSENAF